MASYIKSLLLIIFLSMYSFGVWAQTTSSHAVTSKIIGGNTATEPYSWIVSIQTGGTHFCGGTLIGKDWVVTAAHCLEGELAEDLTLYIGDENLLGLRLAEKHTAQWIVIHEEYAESDSALYNDIALIKLSNSSLKTPIKIIDSGANSDLTQNEQMRTIGWGLTDPYDENSLSSSLLQVDVSYQRDEVCEVSYPIDGNYWQHNLCAGEDRGGKDSCTGDSGGPLLVKANGEWALAGIVSWGTGCAAAGYYGVYTEVVTFQTWIEQRRSGITLIGPQTMGYLGEGRNKPETFTLVNLSNDDAVVETKSAETNEDQNFVIDEVNWTLINNVIPANYLCEFKVNALGDQLGEHNSTLDFRFNNSAVYKHLTSRVLKQLDTGSFNNSWIWFSGTNKENGKDYNLPWHPVLDESETALQSGAIDQAENSVLLTYLNRTPNIQPTYLVFDARVDSHTKLMTQDSLIVSSGSFRGRINSSEESSLWDTYYMTLTQDVNLVKFDYSKDKWVGSGADLAQIKNLKICTEGISEGDEWNCSVASDHYSDIDLTLVDDPASQAQKDSVCKPLNYWDSEIDYASRLQEDKIFLVARGSSAGSIFIVVFLIPLLMGLPKTTAFKPRKF